MKRRRQRLGRKESQQRTEDDDTGPRRTAPRSETRNPPRTCPSSPGSSVCSPRYRSAKILMLHTSYNKMYSAAFVLRSLEVGCNVTINCRSAALLQLSSWCSTSPYVLEVYSQTSLLTPIFLFTEKVLVILQCRSSLVALDLAVADCNRNN